MLDSDAIMIRVAGFDDIDVMRHLMQVSIDRLQEGFLTLKQIAVSHHFMQLDTQLVRDGTYFIAEIGGEMAGCGGWSYRATLYGGDASVVARDPVRLDPATEPARIRAMYTSPGFVRRGVGRAILQASEYAARAAGFKTAELMATLAGVPLYACGGYRTVEAIVTDPIDDVSIPLVRMRRTL